MNEPIKKELKQFGIGAGVVFFAVGLFHFVKGKIFVCSFFWATAIVLVILALTVPQNLKPLYRVAKKIGLVINGALTYIILFVVFYLIVTPIGLVMRVLGKGPLDKNFKTGKESYWIKKDEERTKQSLEKQY